jgi:uncharacterized ferredoxin-like protein
MLAILRAIDSRSEDCGNDEFLLFDQLSSRSSWKFCGGEIPTLIRPAEIIRDLQRVQMLATLHAIDSRSEDCGNDGFLLCDQLSSRSSRKFRGDGITTLIRLAEIIRDLQRAPTPATLHAIDSRSRDCGNDGFLLCDQLSSRSSRKFRGDGITTLIRLAEIIRDLQSAPTLATLRAADSRSRDCGNDEFLLCDQLSSRSSRKFRGGEIPTLIRPDEIIRDLQRAPKLATLHAIDSRSRDCGNDGFLPCDQLSSRSSRKFRGGEIPTLIRPAEIIRDL